MAEKKLTKNELNKVWWNWICFGQICYNYERMMGLGFCHSMSYAIEKLYGDDEDKKKEALVRHMAYYNTENTFGAIVPGICCSLEEARANGENVDVDAISNLKTALMGPIAGIGDTITQSLVKVILLGICVDMANNGNAFGPILFVLGFSAYAILVSKLCFDQGYKYGKQSVVKLLSGNLVKTITECLGVVGMTVLGALVAKNIGISSKLVFNIGSMTITVQNLLDAIMPKMLNVALFFIVYSLLAKGKKATTVMLYMILSAVVLSLLGVLA